MEIDLSLILGKQVTFPLLCFVSYRLYKNLICHAAEQVPASIELVKDSVAEDTEKASCGIVEKEGDTWEPVSFMKSVKPYVGEDGYKLWSETPPFPYQPFKPGEYRLTMGVRPMQNEYWLMFEDTLKTRIETKWQVISKNYKDVIYHLDPAMVNCDSYTNADVTDRTLVTVKDVEKADNTVCEWYNTVITYLCARYPNYFRIVLHPGNETPGVLYNSIMDEFHPVDAFKYLRMKNSELRFLKYRCFNTDIIPKELTDPSNLSDKVGSIPLVTVEKTKRAHELILAVQRMVEEDLVLLSPNANHQFNNEYIMISGCFAFAAGFNPRQRFLKPMTQIHGPVPEYKIRLQTQMNKFFQTHKPGKLVMRLNFSFQTHSKLFVTDDNKGAEDEEIKAKTLDELHGGHDLHYRSERQCLIKLENTKSMCFSIKTYLWNLQNEFLPNDYYSQRAVIEDLCDAIRGMQDSISQYKRRPEWGPALLEMLESKLSSDD
ncbi:unnamed protein product [Kluyveromyces dobzhanskii CBS 2104]|uniref:WGS project CCBQ000000000 data, contig 00016 n=1 Tax=Kluyveromyces dobzhanskii CBS 2104 TaxID=1427455 RepID=A0A0A8L2F4_9SACH|nr:unnamed protein product [Kluyveromyces dobzhanskii CBS 2104]